MANFQRIAINTAAAHIRFIFAVGLSLFSIRWVLKALGQSDYGLFSVVGSIIIFITFLNGVLATSASRFYSYSIGQADYGEVNLWFNEALKMHIGLAIVLIFFGWPVGEYVISNVLTVPVDRISACLYIFRISLLSAFISMVSVPFVAMFNAKQYLTEIAIWGILQSILSFCLAWYLRYITIDKLLFYSSGMVIITIIVQLIIIVRALYVFRECRISWQRMKEFRRLKQLLSFAVWNLVGSLGVLIRDQGSAILLNIYFGPSINAAYSVANQVCLQTNQLSNAMINAFSPEVTACEGRGDRMRMLSLSDMASRFGVFFVLILAAPLLVEMDFILDLWLQKPPLYTSLFCQLILLALLLDRIGSGYMLASQAHGKIALYQLSVGFSYILTIPLAWSFIQIKMPPTSVGAAFIITMIFALMCRIVWGKLVLGISKSNWVTAVFKPSAMLMLISIITGKGIYLLLPPSYFRLAAVILGSISVATITFWYFALGAGERELAVINIKRTLKLNKY